MRKIVYVIDHDLGAGAERQLQRLYESPSFREAKARFGEMSPPEEGTLFFGRLQGKTAAGGADMITLDCK